MDSTHWDWTNNVSNKVAIFTQLAKEQREAGASGSVVSRKNSKEPVETGSSRRHSDIVQQQQQAQILKLEDEKQLRKHESKDSSIITTKSQKVKVQFSPDNNQNQSLHANRQITRSPLTSQAISQQSKISESNTSPHQSSLPNVTNNDTNVKRLKEIENHVRKVDTNKISTEDTKVPEVVQQQQTSSPSPVIPKNFMLKKKYISVAAGLVKNIKVSNTLDSDNTIPKVKDEPALKKHLEIPNLHKNKSDDQSQADSKSKATNVDAPTPTPRKKIVPVVIDVDESSKISQETHDCSISSVDDSNGDTKVDKKPNKQKNIKIDSYSFKGIPEVDKSCNSSPRLERRLSFPYIPPSPKMLTKRASLFMRVPGNPSFFQPPKVLPCASILLLGPAGAGKSSTINSLVHKQVCEASTSTADIAEYTVRVPSSEWSEFFLLKFIDTPGFTNDPDALFDASWLTTLTDHLSSVSGLHGKPPSVVLVPICYDEYDSVILEGDRNTKSDIAISRRVSATKKYKRFINFLKMVNHFRQHFNNGQLTNFIFVLTHCMAAAEDNPEELKLKCQSIVTLIENYSCLPEPIALVCAENNLTFLSDNDIYEFPNGEVFPVNLIERMKTLLARKGRDSTNEMIIRTAFGVDYPNCLKILNCKRIGLLPEDHPRVTTTANTLKKVYSDIERTEVSSLLEIGWANVPKPLQDKYPSSLQTLQKCLQMKEIKRFSRLPTKGQEVLGLIRDLPQTPTIADLVTQTLQLQVPHCALTSTNQCIGQGFDIMSDNFTNSCPVQFSGALKLSPVGLIPVEIDCRLEKERTIVFKFFESYEEYALERLRDMHLTTVVTYVMNALPSQPNQGFRAAINNKSVLLPGYNLIQSKSEVARGSSATAFIEYRAFKLFFNSEHTTASDSKWKLNPSFWDQVNSLDALDDKDDKSVEAWSQFFTQWGTHVVKTVHGGGAMQIVFKGNMLSAIHSSLLRPDVLPTGEDETSRVFQWVTGDGLEFAATSDSETGSFLRESDVVTSFHGGDPKFEHVDLTKMPYDTVTTARDAWIASLTCHPVILKSNIVVAPLSDFVKHECKDTADKIELAFHSIYSQFVKHDGKAHSACQIL